MLGISTFWLLPTSLRSTQSDWVHLRLVGNSQNVLIPNIRWTRWDAHYIPFQPPGFILHLRAFLLRQGIEPHFNPYGLSLPRDQSQYSGRASLASNLYPNQLSPPIQYSTTGLYGEEVSWEVSFQHLLEILSIEVDAAS